MPDGIDETELVRVIHGIVEKEGSQVAAADYIGISPAYLSDILAGHRHISADVAERLGYSRKVIYIEKE